MRSPDERTVEHDLSLAFCPACGVVQVVQPFPFRDLVPPYSWVTYREPESHLDKVAETVCRLVEPREDTVVAGLTFKDKTSLDRFRPKGVSRIWSVDLVEDLGAADPNANIESVHGLLTPEAASAIARKRPPADVLFARHIFEHAEKPWRFLQAVGNLLAPDGLLVIEVPDCRANLERQDYTMIWEEHTLYLNPDSMPGILATAGYQCVAVEIHPFPFEDVIVAYARKSPAAASADRKVPPAGIERNAALARAFGQSFEPWTQRYHRLFKDLTRDGRRLAAYGAGHLTCAFLNFHQLADYFAFVVDDSPQKQGLFLPKCRLPIVPRSALTPDKVSACLFGLDPQLENRIIADNTAYVAAGGKFYSMFVDSERSIRPLLDRD
jgi:C-methyltransferase-like protein/methyltransferase family protein